MCKRLVGVLLAGLVVAGCGTSGGSSGEGGQAPPPPAPKPPESARTAPAKATSIADKCGIINPQQQEELGFTKPPEPLNSTGHPGCTYQAGDLGHPGWSAFVAVDGQSTFRKEMKKYGSQSKMSELAGYPIAIRPSTANGCIVYTDSSDHGFMITNIIQNSATDAPFDLCQQAQKVTEAALQNVPNA